MCYEGNRSRLSSRGRGGKGQTPSPFHSFLSHPLHSPPFYSPTLSSSTHYLPPQSNPITSSFIDSFLNLSSTYPLMFPPSTPSHPLSSQIPPSSPTPSSSNSILPLVRFVWLENNQLTYLFLHLFICLIIKNTI